MQKILNNIEDFRKKFNLNIPEEWQSNESKSNIFELMLKKDNILLLRFPNNLNISGMFLSKKELNKTNKCIYINTNEPLGRQYFSFVHELYHAYYEISTSLFCSQKDMEQKVANEIEKRANIFASNILIPRYDLIKSINELRLMGNSEITEQHIVELQKKFNVTFQAMLYAINDLKNLSDYEKHKRYIPKIPDNMKRFFRGNYDVVEKIVKRYGSNLNSIEDTYYLPSEFKDNLINNYKKKIVSKEEVEYIYEFFEKEKLLKYLMGDSN